MRLSINLGLVLIFACLPSVARADTPPLQSAIGDPDNFTLSGSLRARYELLDGQAKAGFNANDEQLAIRTTLFAEYHDADWRIGGEIYDSRAYLTERGGTISANEVNTLELVQAYVAKDFRDAFGQGSKATLQVGRMMLNLGSRRLIAADDYRNTTNGYTGIRGDVKLRDGAAATLIYVLPQIRLPSDLDSVLDQKVRWDRESFDLRLWGGIVSRTKTIGDATAEISYFRLQERDGPSLTTRNRNLHTIAARVIRDPKPSRIDYELEAIYQLGTVRDGLAANAARLDVRARFLHADIGYTFPGSAKLRLSLEYDYASGDGRGPTYRRFDTLFGMRRADLAPAGIYNAIGRSNINTPGIRLEVAPSKRLDAFVSYRAMWLASRTDSFSTTGVRDASGRSGSFAGHQLEARVRYWIIPDCLRGEVNGVWLAKGDFLQSAPNAPDTGDTHYLAAGLTATF